MGRNPNPSLHKSVAVFRIPSRFDVVSLELQNEQAKGAYILLWECTVVSVNESLHLVKIPICHAVAVKSNHINMEKLQHFVTYIVQ